MDQPMERMASEFGGRVRDKVSSSHQFDVSQANSVKHLAQPIVDFIHRLCREASRAEGIYLSVLDSLISTPRRSRIPELTIRVSDNAQLGTAHTYHFKFEGDVTLFGDNRYHQRENYIAMFEMIVQRFEAEIKVAARPQSIQPDT